MKSAIKINLELYLKYKYYLNSFISQPMEFG